MQFFRYWHLMDKVTLFTGVDMDILSKDSNGE